MSKYLSYRIRRLGDTYKKKNSKSYKSMHQQIMHDLRYEKMQKGYLKDPATKNARIIKKGINSPEKIKDFLASQKKKMFDDYKQHHGRALDKRTHPYLSHVLSFSSNFTLTYDESVKMLEVIKKFVIQEFSDFISIVGHSDEKSYHIHINTLNYNFHTHKSIGRNLDTSELQTKIATHLVQHNMNYNHQRGVNKKSTNAVHKEIMESKREEIQNLEQKNIQISKESEKLALEAQQINEINQTLRLEIDDTKSSYNDILKQYNDLVSEMEFMIDEILSITDDTRTSNKMNKILNVMNGKIDETKINKLIKLRDRLQKTKTAVTKKNKNNLLGQERDKD